MDRAFDILASMARQKGYQFSGNTKNGTIMAMGQTVRYSVSGKIITIIFPNYRVEWLASGEVKALLDDVFSRV